MAIEKSTDRQTAPGLPSVSDDDLASAREAWRNAQDHALDAQIAAEEAGRNYLLVQERAKTATNTLRNAETRYVNLRQRHAGTMKG